MHGAGAFVAAAQAVVRARGRDQLAFGAFGAKAFGGDDHLAAQRDAVVVLEAVAMQQVGRGRRGGGRAIASAALMGVTLPWPMAAMRSIQASTDGVASRMPAMQEVCVRVNHNGW